MSAFLIRLLLIVGMLGNIGQPTLALGHDHEAQHKMELAVGHALTDDVGPQDDDTPNAPSTLGHHHHVPDIVIGTVDLAATRFVVTERSQPAHEAPMRSFDIAPPTEPPAA